MRTVFDGIVGVHYGQFYLGDGTEENTPDCDCLRRSGVGIAGADPGGVMLLTGLHTGVVDVTVQLGEADPGSNLDAFEDVVEIDFQALDAALAIEEWERGDVTDLGELPAGAGNYRVRYHARGMDAGHVTMTSFDEVIDRYLIQIWPATPSAPKILKMTSTRAKTSL